MQEGIPAGMFMVSSVFLPCLQWKHSLGTSLWPKMCYTAVHGMGWGLTFLSALKRRLIALHFHDQSQQTGAKERKEKLEAKKTHNVSDEL